MDFMSDQLQDGRRIRVLTVVDQQRKGEGVQKFLPPQPPLFLPA